MSWNDMELHEIFTAVDLEYQAASGANGSGQMQQQIDAWSKMQELFTWQHRNLSGHRRALAGRWASDGARAYLGQVDDVLDTLASAAGVSGDNMSALSNMKQSLDRHYPVIKQAFEEYQRDWQQQVADYTKKKQKYDSETLRFQDRDTPFGGAPDEPDLGEVVKPYLHRARKAAHALSNDYAENNSSLLLNPPEYKGPGGTRVPNPPASVAPTATGLVGAGMAAPAGVAMFSDPSPAPQGHPNVGAVPPPPSTDPGPILAGGVAPTLPHPGAGAVPSVGTPSAGPTVGPGGLSSPLPFAAGPARFSDSPSAPRTSFPRESPPAETEFAPRTRSGSSVLGRNPSKASVDRLARERYGPTRGTTGGRALERSSERVLGERATRRPFSETGERTWSGLVDSEPAPERPSGRTARVLGEEQRLPTSPTRRPASAGPAARNAMPASEEPSVGRMLGGSRESGPGHTVRSNPAHARRGDRDPDEATEWGVAHEGAGVIDSGEARPADTGSGPAIGDVGLSNGSQVRWAR